MSSPISPVLLYIFFTILTWYYSEKWKNIDNSNIEIKSIAIFFSSKYP